MEDGIISIRTLTIWLEKWTTTLVVLAVAAYVGWCLFLFIGDTFETINCVSAEIFGDPCNREGETHGAAK